MSDLLDHQFEILPTEDAADGFVFGIRSEVSLNEDGFDPGEAEWVTQDVQNSRRGVNGFGRDVRGPKTWTWTSHTNRSEVGEAADTLDRFSAAWAPDIARTPGLQTCIRYKLAGRHRRIYGRPRRFAAPPTNLILSGFVPITHDFQCVDANTYDDAESQALILYASSVTGGGFEFPVTFPVSTLPSNGNGSGQLTVTGSTRTYPIIRFNGPWTNPFLDTGDWSISWKGSVAAGKWVEIDCRPWALTVKNQDGASVVNGMDRRTYLEDYWFAPNSQPQIFLGGSAPGGGASALVRWRNAWTSI